ncbi:flagellar basal body rod protein FlgB [Thiohalophilus sp.]|uniref:flagellar basal body rod protein FlgB n=1 Tax=Thiohalophilus sp. TaxID=3028392 RepID=UPI002ACD7289|nr:flagellar basal body rod protein FlgB [Thiohalophilus sp.]MDZ7802614.1 flagellar basal body rod protein FlgB [Thiohalophilus sp.]
MPMNFDSVLGIHETALNLQAKRAELLGANLANSDTPGYKARDIDFRAALRDAQELGTNAGPMQATSRRHMQPENYQMGAQVMYRQPLQPSLDGNTVESEVEMGAFSENSMRYMFSLQIVNGRLQKLITAFKGGQ